MIFNFYTYLFLSAMAAGNAMAILIRTLAAQDRKILWSVTSVSFLIHIIVSISILILGLGITDPASIVLSHMLIFSLIVFILLTASFLFFKLMTYVILIFIFIGITAFFYSFLNDFKSFDEDALFTVQLLKSDNSQKELEIKGFDGYTSFTKVENNKIYPVFLIIDIPQQFFLLNNNTFIKFTGFISEIENLESSVSSDFVQEGFADWPVFNYRFIEPPPLGDEIMSTVSARMTESGDLIFMTENN